MPKKKDKRGGKTTTKKAMPIKWHMILDLMPSNDWCVTKVARKVGYTENYIESRLLHVLKRDVRFCSALEKRKQEFTEKLDVTLEFIQNNAYKAMKVCMDENGLPKNRLLNEYYKGNEQLAKTIGAFIDKQVNINADIPDLCDWLDRRKEELQALTGKSVSQIEGEVKQVDSKVLDGESLDVTEHPQEENNE